MQTYKKYNFDNLIWTYKFGKSHIMLVNVSFLYGHTYLELFCMNLYYEQGNINVKAYTEKNMYKKVQRTINFLSHVFVVLNQRKPFVDTVLPPRVRQ